MKDFGEKLFPYGVRKLEFKKAPVITKEQKLRKEQLGLALKIETMLSYAQIGEKLDQVLTENWLVSEKTLESAIISQLHLVPDKTAVDKFKKAALEREDQHIKLLEEFRKRAGLNKTQHSYKIWNYEESISVGRQIFFELTGVKPQGNVTVLANSLCVGIYVPNDEDFQRLDRGKNIGGFYDHEAALKSDKSIKFPLIVTHVDPGILSSVLKHELGHAINDLVWESFDKRTDLLGGENLRAIPKLSMEQLSEQSRTKKLFRPDNPVMKWALARAKDEILADYYQSNRFDYAYTLNKRGGVYDYPQDFLNANIPEYNESTELMATTIYDEFWDKYGKIVSAAHKAAAALKQRYGSEGYSLRGKLLPWLMKQVPLDKWEHVVDRIFMKECNLPSNEVNKAHEILEQASDAYNHVTNRAIEKYGNKNGSLSTNLLATADEVDTLSSLINVKRNLHNLCTKISEEAESNQQQSFYRLLEGWEENIRNIKTNFQSLMTEEHIPKSHEFVWGLTKAAHSNR